MKKLLTIFILMVSILFISGCTSEEKTNPEASIDSQINQQSDAETPDLMIKPRDVPGLTLMNYHFSAVPKSGIITFKNESGVKEYKDVLPLGNRNVGEVSVWGDESGRQLIFGLGKYDSNIGLEDFKVDFTYTTEGAQKMKDFGCDFGDPNIGDFSNYESCPYSTSDIKYTKLKFAYKNNLVSIFVIDENDKSLNEALRIAKIVEGRLD